MKKNKKDQEEIEIQAPLIYLFIYKRLVERFRVGESINYRYILEAIKMVAYNVPKKYHNIIIKELEEFGLLKRIVSGRSPEFELQKKDYEDVISNLNKIKGSTQRYKILKKDYDKLLERLKHTEEFNQRYEILKTDYTKRLKKLEEYHYW